MREAEFVEVEPLPGLCMGESSEVFLKALHPGRAKGAVAVIHEEGAASTHVIDSRITHRARNAAWLVTPVTVII